MKYQLRIIPFLLSAASLAAAQKSQPQVSFTQEAGGTWNAGWAGMAQRTYFLQWSLDLENWHYAPLVEFGSGLKSSAIHAQGNEKFFVRLLYVDDTSVTNLYQARGADFDNDGIPNYYEVETLGTDPLDKNSTGGDLDYDGLVDGLEMYFFGNLDQHADDNDDGDEFSNLEEFELNLDPTTNDRLSSAADIHYSYHFDQLAGTNVQGTSAVYQFDAAGNIETASSH